ncbi:MAG TPA: DUF3108 domain-containing protein [Pyrinomonadaceae bacterium]
MKRLSTMNRLRTALAAVALLFAVLTPAYAAASGSDAAPTRRESPAPLPFEPTEQLVYEGSFSKLLLRGIKIAEFRFTSGRPDEAQLKSVSAGASNVAASTAAADSAARVHLIGDVKSAGWFQRLFSIDFHFRVESLVERAGFSVLSTKKLDEQGKRVRTSEAMFDRVGKQVSWTEVDPNDPKREPRIVNTPLEGAAQDIVSAVYFLRTQQLTPGRSFEIVLSDSGQVYRVPATVVAEPKRIKTVLGKVSVVRVEVALFGEGRPVEGEGKMSIWFTDDARRVPVRARMSSDIGMIDIKLKSVSTNPPVQAQNR